MTGDTDFAAREEIQWGDINHVCEDIQWGR